MGEGISLMSPQTLKLYEPDRVASLNLENPEPKTPNEWFVQRFRWAFEQFGSPFLELVEPVDQFSVQVLPVSLNLDFFAGVLGGRRDLGHHVVYFEPEMQWYFRDWDGIFKITSGEKLANLYRALMMKCAQDMPGNVHKLNLFHEFRSDKTAKAVVQRAKSVLAADSLFFSASSPHQRIKGPELHERLIMKLVETMLEPREGAILTVTQAYQIFCRLSEQRSLGVLKRSVFRELIRDLIRDRFNLALRHDVPDSANKHQQAWKGLAMVDVDVLAA